MTAADAPLRRLLPGYLVGGVLLWLFLRGADWQVSSRGWQSINWTLVTAAIAMRFGSLVASALRWQVLLSPVRRIRLGSIIAVTLMGMAVSTGVSMQAAEVARPYLLGRLERLDTGAAFGTVAIEWCVDLLGTMVVVAPVLLGVWATGSSRGATGRWPLTWQVGAATLLAAAGLAGLRALLHHSGPLSERVARLPVLPGWTRRRLAGQIAAFSSGLGILHKPGALTVVVAYSVLVALLTSLSAWLALAAFGLPLSPLAGAIVLGLITVGGMTPSPGAIGGFHAVCELGLVGFFGLDRVATVLPVVGLHAVMYLPAAAVGALCFLGVRGPLPEAVGA